MTILEIIAMSATLLCVYLTAKQKIYAWPVGIIGVIAFFFLFLDQKFYFQTILQVIFLIQSVYGWISWKKQRENNDFSPKSLQNVKFATHYAIIIVISTLGGAIGGTYIGSNLPLLDSITTGFSILATYYLAKHYIEAWIIWMGVNILLFCMTLYQGLYIVAGMEVILFVISLNAYKSWKRNLRTDSV